MAKSVKSARQGWGNRAPRVAVYAVVEVRAPLTAEGRGELAEALEALAAEVLSPGWTGGSYRWPDSRAEADLVDPLNPSDDDEDDDEDDEVVELWLDVDDEDDELPDA